MINEVSNIKENRMSTNLLITAIFSGVFSIVLGLIVLVGWYTGNKTLIQVIPVFVPMQYNTALGFALCGTGMILAILDNRYITVAIGILVICLGGLTLLEYISGLNIGIDELLMKHDIVVKTSHPGRMAPNTATCFILIGGIFIFSIFPKKLIYQAQYKAVISSLVFALSIVALLGYASRHESAYGWGSLTRMAMHTSIGFIMLSLGALVLNWRKGLSNETKFPGWLPFSISIGALAVTACFWQVLQSEYEAVFRQSGVSTGLSTLSMIVLIIGSLLSIALGLAVYLAHAYVRSSQEIAIKNKTLERVIVEKEKAQSQVHRLSHAIEHSSATIVITDSEGNIEYVNPKFTQLTGYSPEETIGKNPRVLKSGKILPEVYEKLWSTIKSGNEWNGEFCNKKKNGELYWEHASISPVKNDEGVIINFIAVKDDITERKRIENELRENEDKFRAISTAANDAIIMIDNENCVSLWNKAAENMFGFSSEEIIGKKVYEKIMPPRFREGHIKGFYAFSESGQGPMIGKTVELVALRKDGTEFIADHSFSSVKIRDKWNSICIIRDTTERKRNEEQIKSSLKEKEVLLSEIHHRVKNNMQIISSILNLQSGFTKDNKLAEVLDDCQNRIQSMALVHEMLYKVHDFTKIDFKDYISELIGRLIVGSEDSAGNVTSKIVAESIKLNIDTIIPIGLIVNELITNSIKYAFRERKGNEIEVSLQNTEIEGEFEMILSDNGIGLPEEIDIKSAKTLGLRLIKILGEEQLNGSIELRSNKGTQFRMKFKETRKA